MIGTSNLGKSWGERVLFEGVSLKLNAGSRYGLVGANGSGKTTFLKILAGDEPASEGTVTIPKTARLGVLRQDRFADDAERVIDAAMQGDELAWAALASSGTPSPRAAATSPPRRRRRRPARPRRLHPRSPRDRRARRAGHPPRAARGAPLGAVGGIQAPRAPRARARRRQRRAPAG
ncbi:MAG: ATP-binding cassette domain-containing protein [Polyangiales bacterium]